MANLRNVAPGEYQVIACKFLLIYFHRRIETQSIAAAGWCDAVFRCLVYPRSGRFVLCGDYRAVKYLSASATVETVPRVGRSSERVGILLFIPTIA
jgi:hypothetical protein